MLPRAACNAQIHHADTIAFLQNSPLSDPRSHAPDVSELCMDLLMRLLDRNPNTRCKMGHVLNHSWFLSGLPSDAMSMNRMCIQST